jgi:hypothetical protein
VPGKAKLGELAARYLSLQDPRPDARRSARSPRSFAPMARRRN